MNRLAHYQNSSLRERIVEHVFVGDVLRRLWQLEVIDVEVLRSEFDAHGYDIILARKKIIRHIQFKTGTKIKPDKVSIHCSLEDKPSGCVIWIRVTDDLQLGPFYWFGSSPGEPLPRIAHLPNSRRATRNKMGERPIRQNHREVSGKEFRRLETLDDVLKALFGDLQTKA